MGLTGGDRQGPARRRAGRRDPGPRQGRGDPRQPGQRNPGRPDPIQGSPAGRSRRSPAQRPAGALSRVTGPEVGLPALLGQVVIGLLIGIVGLVLIDGLFALLGLGLFGHVSGWLAAILPVWLFVEEFRAWPGVVLRIGAAAFAALVGLAIGSLAGGAAGFLPPLGVGAVGAAVATLSYTVLWYFGIRWLARRVGER
jgi:hypothetical protein